MAADFGLLLVADARVTLVSPSAGLHPLTKKFIEQYPDRITYHDRTFGGPSDLEGVDMVLTAIDDVDKSREICGLARERRIPINVADIPPSCDFYFGSQIRDGPLQVMISTNGQSPKLANLIRRQIEAAIPARAGAAIEKVGALRSKLKERAPGVGGDVGRRRMRWMVDVCSSWDMDELAMLDEQMMARLLDEGWENQTVPRLEDVGGLKRAAGAASPGRSVPLLLPTALGFVVGMACTACVLLARRR